MSIRDIRELLRRGVLRFIEGRASYPHPWESGKPYGYRATEIKERTGLDEILLPVVEGCRNCWMSVRISEDQCPHCGDIVKDRWKGKKS